MKTPIELIQPDEGSSLRLLHQKVTADIFPWNYHYHPELELVYVNNGTGRRHVGNHLSYYQDGDLVLIGPHLPHSGFGFGAPGVHEEIVIQFKNDFLGTDLWSKPEMMPVKQLFERSRYGICFYGDTKKRIGGKLEKLPEMNPFSRLISLMEIFGELAGSEEYIMLNESSQTFGFNQKDQTRLQRIYDYVEKNYPQPIDINAVAGIANLSVPAFCNYFKKMVSLTYTDFLNEYRIAKACEMLLSDKSILDICFECGFTSQSYFSKVFKKVKAKTPMEFRKSLISKKHLSLAV